MDERPPIVEPTQAPPVGYTNQTVMVGSGQKRHKNLIIGIVVTLVVLVGVGGVYAWQQSKVTSLKKQVAGLKEEVKSLKQADSTDNEGSGTIYGGIQAKARDTERKTDINSLQSHIEVVFATTGHYPSLTEMNSATWREENIPGLDAEALNEPQSSVAKDTLVAKPATGAYAYDVTDENGASCEADATLCMRYTLTAMFETTVNGSKTYTKKSS